MSKVWKVLALLLAVTALVWLTTLWRWQSALIDPTPQQLLLNLVVLPLTFTAALVAMVWGAKRLRRYAAAPTALPASSPAAGATPTEAPPAGARPGPHRVLAAGVQVRAGSTWEEAQSRIAKGDCRFQLDAQIKDDDGIAIFTAPVDDLATDAVADAFEQIDSSRTGEPRHGETPPEVLRALTLLELTTLEMLDAVESQWRALAVPLPSVRQGAAVPELPPVVSIRVGLPARWSADDQQRAERWLHDLMAPTIDAGLTAAGQSRAMANTARPAVQLHVHPVESAEAWWALLEQQLQQWHRERQPGVLWALAADSLVGEHSVEAMTHANTLFSGRHQQGRVPGEGAAGLLLASTTWATPADASPPLALLHAASLARRDKSADAGGRITSQCLVQALQDTLQGTAIDVTKIAHLTTDADQRASRTAEVYETVQELLPHLDAAEHALRLGLGCGDSGIARLAACAALTAAQVQQSESPALVLGTHSPLDRLAVLLSPVETPPLTV